MDPKHTIPIGGAYAKARVRTPGKKERPSRPLSAYNFFFKEERAKLLKEAEEFGAEKLLAEASGKSFVGGKSTASSSGDDPRGKSNLFGVLGKIIGQRWKKLPAEAHKKYEVLAEEDKKRHRRETEAYKESVLQESALYRASVEGRLGNQTQKEPETSVPSSDRLLSASERASVQVGGHRVLGSSLTASAPSAEALAVWRSLQSQTGSSTEDLLLSEFRHQRSRENAQIGAAQQLEALLASDSMGLAGGIQSRAPSDSAILSALIEERRLQQLREDILLRELITTRGSGGLPLTHDPLSGSLLHQDSSLDQLSSSLRQTNDILLRSLISSGADLESGIGFRDGSGSACYTSPHDHDLASTREPLTEEIMALLRRQHHRDGQSNDPFRSRQFP